jgi:hypothetical protein
MKGRSLACGAIAAALLLGGGFFGGPEGVVVEAHAEEAQGGVTSPTCLIKGTFPPPKNTELFDATTGGNVIGKLTGASLPMTLFEIPFDPTAGRARLRTSTGSGSMRLDGFVAVGDLPIFTTRDIAVSNGNIWVSSAQKVRLVRAREDSITFELSVGGTMNQTVRATAPCDAFSLARGAAKTFEVPTNARGYMMKKSTLELFDKPNGDVIFTINMMEGTGQLFWSSESKAGFVHVMGRSDLVFDAWARFRDLEQLKKGEMTDTYVPTQAQASGAQLAFDNPPPIFKATREIPIRATRDEKAKPIGVVEVDAEIYVMETITKWSNIVPKHLGIVAPPTGGFWVPSSEVGQ